MKTCNEIQLGRSHRADVIVGAICGALLAAAVISDAIRLIVEWLLG